MKDYLKHTIKDKHITHLGKFNNKFDSNNNEQ